MKNRNGAHIAAKAVCLKSRVAVAVALLMQMSYALASEVWVVTDRQHPVKASSDVRIIELDAPSFIQAELSAKLPRDLHRASAIVQQRIMAGGPELQRRFAKAYQGVVDAWSVGVEKIPAVVVDRRYVVYGQTNVEMAVSQIERYRREHP